jgi:hypothetical protein
MFGDETWQGAIELSMLPDARQLRFASFSLCASQTYHVPKGTPFSLFVLPEASSSLIVSCDDCQEGLKHVRAGEAGFLSIAALPTRARARGLVLLANHGSPMPGLAQCFLDLLELIVLAGCESWYHVAFATIARALSAIHIPNLHLT